MKTLLLILSILLFPAISFAGQSPHDTFWFCYQVGSLHAGKGRSVNLMAISNVHSDKYHSHYDSRRMQFFDLVKKMSKGKFEGNFEPKCVGFDDPKKAMKYRSKNIMRAEHGKYKLLQVEFVYDPDKKTDKQQLMY